MWNTDEVFLYNKLQKGMYKNAVKQGANLKSNFLFVFCSTSAMYIHIVYRARMKPSVPESPFFPADTLSCVYGPVGGGTVGTHGSLA